MGLPHTRLDRVTGDGEVVDRQPVDQHVQKYRITYSPNWPINRSDWLLIQLAMNCADLVVDLSTCAIDKSYLYYLIYPRLTDLVNEQANVQLWSVLFV